MAAMENQAAKTRRPTYPVPAPPIRRRRRGPECGQGFTLLEVLVAVVVIAALGTALLTSLQQTTRAMGLAREVAATACEAERVEAEARLGASPALAAGTNDQWRISQQALLDGAGQPWDLWTISSLTASSSVVALELPRASAGVRRRGVAGGR